MKRFEVYETKRNALGLSRAQVGELAGVSSSTVANYEAGKEVSLPYVKSITAAIDNEFRALDKTQFLEKKLLMQVLQIEREESKEAKLKTLGYAMLYASKLQVELMGMEDFKD